MAREVGFDLGNEKFLELVGVAMDDVCVRCNSFLETGTAGAEKRLLSFFLSGSCVPVGDKVSGPGCCSLFNGASCGHFRGGRGTSRSTPGIFGIGSGSEKRTPRLVADLDVFRLDFSDSLLRLLAVGTFEDDLTDEPLDCGAVEGAVSSEDPD